jgi:hypothetical protein
MGAALVIAMVAIPLIVLQLGRGRIPTRAGTVCRESNPPLFWFIACIEVVALVFFLVVVAINSK